MKQFLIIILFTLSTFASEVATKDDIKELKSDMRSGFSELRKDMRENNRILLEVIRANQEATNKRFEAFDKRFETMQNSIDKRFIAMQNSIDKRFDDVNKRFDDVNKRFEDVNKRFDDMNSKFNMIVTIMLAGFTLIMGYLIKERYSIKKDVKDEVDKELEIKLTKKADINLVERVVNVLEEFGKRNRDIANVLKKHNFIIK